MRNEFDDDEAGRENIRNRKRGFDSKPDPSDDDYYLDDDYENYQEQKYGRSNQAAAGHDLTKKADDASVRRSGAGERTRSTDRSQPSSGNVQAAFRGQSSSVAGTSKNQGTAGSRTASGNSQGAVRGQIVIGDGGTRQQQRVQGQDRGVAASRSAAQAEKKEKSKAYHYFSGSGNLYTGRHFRLCLCGQIDGSHSKAG